MLRNTLPFIVVTARIGTEHGYAVRDTRYPNEGNCHGRFFLMESDANAYAEHLANDYDADCMEEQLSRSQGW